LGARQLAHFPGEGLLARLISPYDVPSFGPNPLEALPRESVDAGRWRRGWSRSSSPRLACAQAARIFRNRDVTWEALLASACLPQLFQAVEIDREPYWGGGFAGNPTLVLLVTELASDNTILVPVNPIERPGTPRRATSSTR
jgi:NTE family protein